MHPAFILGYSKSGTSLLVALLDGHPNITVIPEESDYFDSLYFFVERFCTSNKLSKDEKIKRIYQHLITSTHIRNLFKGKNENDPKGNFDYTDFDTAEFENAFKFELTKREISHQNVLCALAIAYNAGIHKESNQRMWLEKTPYHYVNVKDREETLEKFFPNYKVVHIFRDPRDNYLAYSKKRPELSIHDICCEWKQVAKLALNWEKKERNLIIRYEDLVLNTEDTMKRIRDFFNIREDPCLYEPTKNGVPWFGNSMFGQKSSKISKDRINRYEKLLDPKSIKRIESYCFEEMNQLGYSITYSKSSQLSLSYFISKLKYIYKSMYRTNFIRTILRFKY